MRVRGSGTRAPPTTWHSLTHTRTPQSASGHAPRRPFEAVVEEHVPVGGTRVEKIAEEDQRPGCSSTGGGDGRGVVCYERSSDSVATHIAPIQRHGYMYRTSMVWCVLLDVPTPPEPNAAQLALYSIRFSGACCVEINRFSCDPCLAPISSTTAPSAIGRHIPPHHAISLKSITRHHNGPAASNASTPAPHHPPLTHHKSITTTKTHRACRPRGFDDKRRPPRSPPRSIDRSQQHSYAPASAAAERARLVVGGPPLHEQGRGRLDPRGCRRLGVVRSSPRPGTWALDLDLNLKRLIE